MDGRYDDGHVGDQAGECDDRQSVDHSRNGMPRSVPVTPRLLDVGVHRSGDFSRPSRSSPATARAEHARTASARCADSATCSRLGSTSPPTLRLDEARAGTRTQLDSGRVLSEPPSPRPRRHRSLPHRPGHTQRARRRRCCSRCLRGRRGCRARRGRCLHGDCDGRSGGYDSRLSCPGGDHVAKGFRPLRSAQDIVVEVAWSGHTPRELPPSRRTGRLRREGGTELDGIGRFGARM